MPTMVWGMLKEAPKSLPDEHAEIIAMLRTYAANSPDSLREHVDKALDEYEASGAWQSDDLSAYE